MKFEFKLEEKDILRIIERGLRDMIVGNVKVEDFQRGEYGGFIIYVDIENGGSDGN